MPESHDLDVIRMSLPPDGDLRVPLEVAVAVLARRERLSDDAVQAARRDAGDAFDDVARAGAVVEVEILLDAGALLVHLRAGGVERRIEIPGPSTSPGPAG